ncbi:MAG: carboxypeptidase regulatory-like domain-containing protein [Gemmatimonadota bacterium]
MAAWSGTTVGRAAAQEPVDREGLPRGSISGVVVDAETDSPIDGARVALEPLPAAALDGDTVEPADPFGRAGRTTTSDTLGRYAFVGLPPGRYGLSITRVGYRDARIEVRLRRTTDSRVSIALTVEPIALAPVEARGAAPEPYARTLTITEETDRGQRAAVLRRQREHLATDVRALTHAEVVEAVTLGEPDLFRALHRLPGVTAPHAYTAELQVRGAPPGHTRVRIDGVPVYSPLHAFGVFSAVTPDAVASALLYPGVRPAPVGGGAAGVLDLRTRSGRSAEELRGLADISLASARLALDRRAFDGRAAWMVAFRRSWLDGATRLAEHVAGPDHIRRIPYAFDDIVARADVRIDDGVLVEASGFRQRDAVSGDLPDALDGVRATWGDSGGRLTVDAPIGSWRGRHTLGVSRSSLRVRTGLPDADPNPGGDGPPVDHRLIRSAVSGSLEPDVAGGGSASGPSIAPEPRSGRALGADTAASADGESSRSGSAGTGSRWRVGYEATWRTMSYRGSGPRPYAGWPLEDVDSLAVDGSLVTAALWVDRRGSPVEDLELRVGARLEGGGAVSNESTLRIAPRMTARYRPVAGLALAAGFGRSYGYVQTLGPTAPAFHDALDAGRILLLAGAEVPALRADLATVGGEAWLGDAWLVSANAFLRRTAGYAFPDPRPGRLLDRPTFVVGENGAHGIEVAVRRVAGRWTVSAGYTLTESRVHLEGVSYRAPASPRHAVDATLMTRIADALRIGAAFTSTAEAVYTPRFVNEVRCDDEDRCRLDAAPTLGPPGSGRAPRYASLDLLVDWTHAFDGWRIGAYVQVRNALGRDNRAAYVDSTFICGDRTTWIESGPTPCAHDEFRRRDEFLPALPRLPLIGVRAAF